MKAMNDFRNTRVAHQEKAVTDPKEARAASVMWVEGLNLLWQSSRTQAASPAPDIEEHDIVRLVAALPSERLEAAPKEQSFTFTRVREPTR